MANISSIMTSDPSGADLVGFAKSTAERLVKDGLTRSQIRNIFTEVRRIEALWGKRPDEALRRLNMLKPKIYYQTERHKTNKSNPLSYLKEILEQAIDQVNAAPADKRSDYFNRFMDLFEAILAYHRALGGRN